MTLDENTRFRITTKLVETLGEQDAAILMEAVLPFDWKDLATKADLAASVGILKTDLDTSVVMLKTDLSNSVTMLRHEISSSATLLRNEFTTSNTLLRTELTASMSALETQTANTATLVRAEMETGFATIRGEIAHALRLNTLTIIGSFTAIASLFAVVTPLLN